MTTTRAVRTRLDLERPVPRSVVEAFSILNDMLSNPDTGQRIHVHTVFIDDHVTDFSATFIPVGKT